MDINGVIHNISTIVEVFLEDGSSMTGSAFYFQQLSPPDPSISGGQWRSIDGMWLVTNRHVLLPRDENGKEEKPESLVFNLRTRSSSDLAWEPYRLDGDEIVSRAKFHPDPNVDVCVLNVYDIISTVIRSHEKYLTISSVSSDNYPGMNKINPHVGSDALVVGYPMGFYDNVNLFPIVKSGIVASGWGAGFKGSPCFLVDAKLFPGSSGSLVISKPTDIVVEDGKMFHAKEKQFAFLGVYSGEFSYGHEDDAQTGFNLGVVWYANLVDEVVSQGVSLNVAIDASVD